MMLRRRMRKAYDAGWLQGHLTPNRPCNPSRGDEHADDRWIDMAYRAGYRDGELDSHTSAWTPRR